MADIIAVKCPTCGANVSRDELRCKYCGADIILRAHKQQLTKSTSNWYNKHKEISEQSKKIMKKEFLDKMPTYRSNGSFLCGTGELDSDEELIYFLPFNGEPLPAWIENDKKNNLFAVTNKRLIAYYPNKYPKYREITLDSIVSVSPLTKDESFKKFFKLVDTYSFTVCTQEGTEKIDGILGEPHNFTVFWDSLVNAISE
jgi:DNA-directed RNA polymerase subunit RPC12/RpoP